MDVEISYAEARRGGSLDAHGWHSLFPASVVVGKVYERHTGKALYSAANLINAIATLNNVASHSFSKLML